MSTATPDNTNPDTGPCRKCTSDIPLEADRCPQCGFEPSVGTLSKILIWMSFMWGTTFAAISLISIIVIFDTATLQTGLTGFGVFAFLAFLCFAYIASKWKVYKQKPAIQPGEDTDNEDIDLSDVSGDIRESWREGRERGKERDEAIKARYYNAVDSIPPVVWTAGVFIGIALSFAAWPLAVTDRETAFGIAVGFGMLILFLSILIDVQATNRRNELNFRWYVYSILPAIPAFGFLFAFVWLYRKRSKTGSIT